MGPEPVQLDVFPLVFRVGQETEFVVEPKSATQRLPEGEYRCYVHPKTSSGGPVAVPAEWGSDGRVRFRYTAEARGEISLLLEFPGGRRHRLTNVFALEPEMAGLLPLRGDFHTHTWHSDGRSSPGDLLEAGWALGLDFMAITDHDNRAGTEEALSVAERLPILVLPGEEVSFDRGHLVAVGTRAAVGGRDSGPAVEAELARIQAELGERGEDEDFAQRYAKAVWAARRIRSLGGLAILAHPFWVTGGEFHLDRLVGRQLCLDGEVDAVELIGEVEFEDNLLSVAQYMEFLREGRSLPVVGNSDTHGVSHTLGWYWTVVFAESLDAESVIAAVKAGRSVACIRMPGESLGIYGPLELVEYAYFLSRHYFPVQDRLHAQGGPGSAVSDYRDRCLGRGK